MAESKLIVKDRGYKALFDRTKQIENSYVRVGVLADDEKGGMHVDGADLTLAEIAAVLEFGTQDGRIPERSVARSTFDQKREEMVALGAKLIGAIIDGKMQIKTALDIMGLTLATAMKLKITEGAGVPPPNAPSTVKEKGSSRPWVDTGRLLNAFTYSSHVGGKDGK